MQNKFNLVKKKVTFQFTDESVFFSKILYDKKIFRFDRDIRSFKKWEFHIFDKKCSFFEEKSIEKFRNKFMKLF
jgi:hypothetical protein